VTTELNACKVLLVDDIKENINILVQALKNEYKLGFALDGESALTYARTQKPDLILLDIMMPGMDGFEVSRHLKSDPRTKNIPFIFITAIDEVENKTAGFELGAVDYITKPFEILEVKARVKTHLSLKVALQTLSRQNAQMRHSLSLAMEVQQNLIPASDPAVDGYDIAGKIIYCDETGGDYYDYLDMITTGSKRLGIVVGDVSGHGIPSALLMTTARAFIRQRASLPGSVAQIVTDANRLLSSDVKDSGRFMTLFFCCLDSQKNNIQWSRAGHDPAIVFDQKKNLFNELDGQGGLPLGVSAGSRYEESKWEVTPGQIIVIFTDGIWETRNLSGEFFGKQRLKNIIRDQADKSAQKILSSVISVIDNFRGAAQITDDMTIVVIKTDPPPVC
jgi:sigma-B regulation protein RsbU (phosphoserine phosphatase)